MRHHWASIAPVLVAAAVAGYLGIVAVAALEAAHSSIWILLAQHLLLLPAVAVYLRRSRGSALRAPRGRILLAGLLVAHVIVVLALSVWWDRGVLWGDEAAYRFSAKIFASGHLAAEAPAPTSPDPTLSARELRFIHHILQGDRWFTKYPPLWPALLALGSLLHARWLVNPILNLVTLWAVWRTARDELGIQDASLPVVLLACSPFFFMMSASQMSHPLCALLIVGASYAALRGMRTARIPELAVALALASLCAFVRPFSALCALLCIGPASLIALARGRGIRAALAILPVALAIGAAAAAGMALWNWYYTGSYWISPYAAYRGTTIPIELSLDLGTFVQNLETNGRWALQGTPAFTFPFAFLLAGYAVLADRARRAQVLFLASFPAVFWAAHLFQPEGSSSRFGDRYLYEALFAVALLAACGASLLVERAGIQRAALHRAFAGLAVIQSIQAAALVLPVLREIEPYVQVNDAVERLPAEIDLVYFTITPSFTGDRFNLNDPDPRRRGRMYLVDPGEDRRAAVACRQGRTTWIVLTYDDAAREPEIVASSWNPGTQAGGDHDRE